MDQYSGLIDQAIQYAKEHATGNGHDDLVSLAMDRLFVVFGKEILSIIPGRVSTEVDAK